MVLVKGPKDRRVGLLIDGSPVTCVRSTGYGVNNRDRLPKCPQVYRLEVLTSRFDHPMVPSNVGSPISRHASGLSGSLGVTVPFP